ncbi:MAG TPA: hypothetical protein VNZ58_08310 [Thermomicrobiales bacterium]|nr:hypothetical protein [Thermomicrobiales bacterium]
MMKKRLLVLIPILLALGVSSTTFAQTQTTVKTAQSHDLGTYLTDDQGMTLYVFDKDMPDKSTCNDTCATNWPPFTAEGALTLPKDIPGKLTQITRDDGSTQVAYNGHPLYHFAADKKPGDTMGEGVGGVWHVAVVSGPGATPGASPGASPMASPEASPRS